MQYVLCSASVYAHVYMYYVFCIVYQAFCSTHMHVYMPHTYVYAYVYVCACGFMVLGAVREGWFRVALRLWVGLREA